MKVLSELKNKNLYNFESLLNKAGYNKNELPKIFKVFKIDNMFYLICCGECDFYKFGVAVFDPKIMDFQTYLYDCFETMEEALDNVYAKA